jgi:Transposase IS66 family
MFVTTVLRVIRLAPAVWFAYSPNRRGEHPQLHLDKFEGILQADAFAGFTSTSSTRAAHSGSAVRGAHPRNFFDLYSVFGVCGIRFFAKARGSGKPILDRHQ